MSEQKDTEVTESEKNNKEIKVLSSQLKKNRVEPESVFYPTSEENKEEINRKKQQSITLFINQLIDAENLLVLAGSGTSLTFNHPKNESSANEEKKSNDKQNKDCIAPSMGDLWESCSTAPNFDEVLKIVKYREVAGTWPDGEEKNDIELLLSLCDTYSKLKELDNGKKTTVRNFVKKAKETILEETNFIDKIRDSDSWDTHNHFIRTLGRRSPKQQRLKLFTTNYDLAFEQAASNTGMIVIDGFEFSSPANFNPSWFQYDVVNRNQNNSYLPNLFHLYKLHGSVDWNNQNGLTQKIIIENGLPNDPVFIYPSSDKYEISYESPYIDMISAFLEAVKKPKTALICIGFGFNDNHLNSAITMALRTNPELMLLVVTLDIFKDNSSFNSEIKSKLVHAIQAGDSRVMLMDTDFATFSQELLPNRHIQTPEEKLIENFAKILEGGSNER